MGRVLIRTLSLSQSWEDRRRSSCSFRSFSDAEAWLFSAAIADVWAEAMPTLIVVVVLTVWTHLVLRPLLHPLAPLVDYRPRATDGVGP